MTSIIIDTNVLIYARDQSSTFHTQAVEILKNPHLELCITTKIISEYFAVCSKLGITENDIISFYDELKRNTTVYFPDPESLTLFETLVKKYKPRGNRVYDLEIVSIMLANGISKLATANVKDFDGITEIGILPLLKRKS